MPRGASVLPSSVTVGDLRGAELSEAFLRWQDTSKDADASSIFGKQGFWVAKPVWYLVFFFGLWWFFDFTYCAIRQPDNAMFGYRACKTPLMMPASLLAGVSVMSITLLLHVRYTTYAKRVALVGVFAGVMHLCNAALILAGNICTQHESGYLVRNGTRTDEWAPDRPCGFEMAIIPLCYGVIQTSMILLLIKPALSVVFGFSLFLMYTFGLGYNQYLEKGGGDIKESMPFFLGPLGAAAVLFFFWNNRQKAIAKAKALTAQDHARYRAVWDKLRASDEDDLRRLEVVWKERVASRKKTRKRQPTMGRGPLYFPGRTWMLRQDPTIAQLFDAADTVNPELQKKCEAWSQSPVVCASEHKGVRAKFHRGKVKKTARAMVKVYRSYDEDVGRLCDLVRCSLVFSSVADLITGLEMICDDPEVEVQFAGPQKQRFALEYDDLLSGGYRDVQLSVKVVTAATKALGAAAANHLCEVQLHLRSFYEQKNAGGGHKNYRVARNLRGA